MKYEWLPFDAYESYDKLSGCLNEIFSGFGDTAFSTSDSYLIGRMVVLDIFFNQRLFEYSFLGYFKHENAVILKAVTSNTAFQN